MRVSKDGLQGFVAMVRDGVKGRLLTMRLALERTRAKLAQPPDFAILASIASHAALMR